MVYDLRSQSLSIGDILWFHQASLVLREQNGVDRVDFALVYDPQNPLNPDNPISGSLSNQELTYQLAPLLPLIQFNPHVASILVFDSRPRFERYVADNSDSYYVWPKASVYAGREYLFYNIANDLLYKRFQERGAIPHLSARQYLIDWAFSFYREEVCPQIPVSVLLRNNPRFGQERNSNLDAWIEFFHHCDQTYPVRFIVIGSKLELDDRLRTCRNVIVAKDHNTSIEQDLTLVQTAPIHMGADSGPSVMALFGSNPYLAANAGIIPHLHRKMSQDGDFLRFHFAGPLQRYCLGQETAELLVREFARMWETVDVANWRESIYVDTAKSKPLTSWLR